MLHTGQLARRGRQKMLLLLQMLLLLLKTLASHPKLSYVLLDGGGGDALVDEAELALDRMLKLGVVRVAAGLVPEDNDRFD